MHKMHKMHGMPMVKSYSLSKLLVIIGALNWGLVGILNFDLIAAVFGKKSIVSRLVYTLVGLSGVYLIIAHKTKFSDLKKKLHRKGKHQYSGKQYSWSGIP